MGGFYDTTNPDNFRVSAVPTTEDNQQNLLISGPTTVSVMDTTSRDRAVTAGILKQGSIIYNTTASQFQGYNGAAWVVLG